MSRPLLALTEQTGRDGVNLRATEQAWPETIKFLKKHVG
jgi:hypothetical protein